MRGTADPREVSELCMQRFKKKVGLKPPPCTLKMFMKDTFNFKPHEETTQEAAVEMSECDAETRAKNDAVRDALLAVSREATVSANHEVKRKDDLPDHDWRQPVPEHIMAVRRKLLKRMPTELERYEHLAKHADDAAVRKQAAAKADEARAAAARRKEAADKYWAEKTKDIPKMKPFFGMNRTAEQNERTRKMLRRWELEEEIHNATLIAAHKRKCERLASANSEASEPIKCDAATVAAAERIRAYRIQSRLRKAQRGTAADASAKAFSAAANA